MTAKRVVQIAIGFALFIPMLVFFLLVEPAGWVFDRTIGKMV